LTRFCSFAAAGLALAMLAGSSSAMTPGPHPGYLHALTELRDARWMIEHRGGNERLLALESGAVSDINAAIGDCRHAAMMDDKNLDSHPPADFPATEGGRLHKALDLLGQALDDVNRLESNPDARGYQRGAARHIQSAIDQVREALGR